MFIALKELKKEKLRFTMIIFVIILIAYLVYFLSSLAFGLAELNKTSLDYWNADAVIITESSNNNLYSSSIDVNDVEDLLSDNTEALSITSVNANINESKSEGFVFMGFETNSSVIIPEIITGSNVEDDFDVLVTGNIRDKMEVNIGDYIEISNTKRKFKIVGFTEDSNYNTAPVVYGKRQMVSNMMMSYDTSKSKADANTTPTVNMPDRVSLVLVKDLDELNKTLIPDDLVISDLDAIINNLPGYTPQVLTFVLMIVSLSIIAAVIMGIFMYILTMQKKSVFAVLKIQGYQNKTIISSIIFQILILVLSGLLISFILNQVTIYFMPPQVPVKVNMILILYVSGFIIVTSLIGALFSAYSVLKIDPLEAL